MRNFVKKQSGITLIALVVTIIVLIILAGVSINMLVGENGIINMAQRAKNETEQAAKDEQQALAGAFESNYVTYNGQLHVEGTKLMNEHNEEVRLKGTVLSNNSHREFSKDRLKTLKSWGTNVIKVGLGNSDNTVPYTNEQQMQKMYQIIDDTIDLDMYVIVIFWSGNNLTENVYNEAIDYFTQIATRYKDVPNLIYEIANEPAHEWEEIKQYANTIIPVIRNISKNALVLCPTRGHNSLSAVIGNTLKQENVMYVAHIYNGEEFDVKVISNAVLNNVPVFISEWSNSNGSGIVSNEMDMQTNRFISQMDRYNISSTFFIVSDSDQYRTSFIQQGCWDKTWDDTVLDSCGIFYKKFVTNTNEIYQYTIEDYTMASDTTLNHGEYIWDEQYIEKITQLITTNTIELPDNVLKAWDISTGSGNVICYLTDNGNGGYIAYIASDGEKVYAPNIIRLFRGFTNLESLDLSYLDTSTTTTMGDWFLGCSNLREIKGLNNFKTSQVTDMSRTFSELSSIEELDLTSFDFSNISSYHGMFAGIKSGTNIYVKNVEDAEFINSARAQNVVNIYYESDGNWTQYQG